LASPGPDQFIERAASSPSTSAEIGSLRAPDRNLNIYSLRLHVANWQVGWGAENLWEREFSTDLRLAREEGRADVDKFFKTCEEHAKAGREILRDLKAVGLVWRIGTPDEMRDIFLQTYEMILAVASEVKFFEIKLDEFAPAVAMTKVSDVRYYLGM
jgi:hypothetical protein